MISICIYIVIVGQKVFGHHFISYPHRKLPIKLRDLTPKQTLLRKGNLPHPFTTPNQFHNNMQSNRPVQNRMLYVPNVSIELGLPRYTKK